MLDYDANGEKLLEILDTVLQDFLSIMRPKPGVLGHVINGESVFDLPLEHT